MFQSLFLSEIGMVVIQADEKSVLTIEFVDNQVFENQISKPHFPNNATSELAKIQLEAYFLGKLQNFDFPIQFEGTDFQQKVWKNLVTIPYGTTCSYLDLARKLGNTAAIRAVGAANGQNQIAIAVPCHRVIGSNGKLVGYAGGLWRKKWLLEHEQKHFKNPNLLF